MPKLKTKSSAKKRFRLTARGKIKMPQSGKRHGMIKRTNSQIRKQRGTTIMSKQDAKIVKLTKTITELELKLGRDKLKNNSNYSVSAINR